MNQRIPALTKRITISIEEELRDDLNFLTENLDINRSALVRSLLINWMIAHKLSFQTELRPPSSKQLQDAIGYDINEELYD